MRKIAWFLRLVTDTLSVFVCYRHHEYTHTGKGRPSTQEQGTGEVIIYSHKPETRDKIRFDQIV